MDAKTQEQIDLEAAYVLAAMVTTHPNATQLDAEHAGGLCWKIEDAARAAGIKLDTRELTLRADAATGYVEPEPCEHGMAAWLCAGPGHYPADGSY